jgi:ADP-ribose pyrophosphatase YjhB (NUDIX family)
MLLEVVHDAAAFKLRVAAVIVRDGRVLLNRIKGRDDWLLPGGTTEFGETARRALVRELREELREDVPVGRLLWVVEHFFDMAPRRWHQVTWLFEAELPEDCHAARFETWDVDGTATRDEFRWIPFADLARLNVHPSFLADEIARLPTETKHVVHLEPAT